MNAQSNIEESMNAVVKTVKAKREIAPVQQESSPMQMLQAAIINKMDPQTIKDLMDLRDRWEATEARKSFTVAMTGFKSEPLEILKKKKVSFETQAGTTSYSHAELSDITDIVGPALAKYELSYRWDVRQEATQITVECILTHAAGHSERVVLTAQADTSGKKNAIQQVASTITYLERYTLLAITGMSTKEMDDDGHGSEPIERISAEQAADLQALLEEVGANKSAFLKYLRIEKLEDITVQAYPDAVKAIERKRKQS